MVANPGETFLDKMIALVEQGKDDRRPPTKYALSILLTTFTIIFLIVILSLQPFAIYSGQRLDLVALIALLVCLIPTTIGGLLSAIGIAGMDRMIQHNVIATSGKAVEARRCLDDVARQDGHDHAGQPRGGGVLSGPTDGSADLRRKAQLASSPTKPPKVDRSSRWPSELRGARADLLEPREVHSVHGETRMSGVDYHGRRAAQGSRRLGEMVQGPPCPTPARRGRRIGRGRVHSLALA